MRNETDKPKATYLKDYQPVDFLIKEVDLKFDLQEKDTKVTSKLNINRNQLSGKHQRALVLDGEEQVLKSVALNGKILSPSAYQVDDKTLTIKEVPDQFTLEVVSLIQPQDNTSLSGLYRSDKMFCTQCEAEGFRKITYFNDRPDNLAKFTTTIIADKEKYPVLLSNGNRVEKGELPEGRHFVKWVDPFKKPAYLFALVAGDLHCNKDIYQTKSGRKIDLEIYVEAENKDKTAHALNSLKKAMLWDEETFGLEYDLDLYMIVAANDFNMGAMENKGLNIFNSKYVLADLQTATDTDFEAIESVIGHEYFHNWTGNRVTCRDWFQLSLKEGLTVFREQLFSADCGNATVKRIQDVNHIRSRQFAEDAGPLAHPVRPDCYIEINNFYTMTIYYKGSEVIRMLHTLLGKQGFRKGMDLYFKRHDGEAATTDNFVAAMSDANNMDLEQFKRWYVQAGTPVLTARAQYDAKEKTYTLTLSQHTAPTPDGSGKLPFVIPVRFSLISKTGAILSKEQVLVLKEEKQIFNFNNITSEPIPSLLGGFSAPVKLQYDYQDSDLIFLMGHDPDLFNRWNASHELFTQLLFRLYEDPKTIIPLGVADGLKHALHNTKEQGLLGHMFVIPSFDNLIESMSMVDPVRLMNAKDALKEFITKHLYSDFSALHSKLPDSNIELTDEAIGARQLKNTILRYLVLENPETWIKAAEAQYHNAKNMTDTMAALHAVNDIASPIRTKLMNDFYEKWQHVPLVVNKWLSLEAFSRLPETPTRVRELVGHKSFAISNPNNVYALIRAFAANPHGFHQPSGVGYAFLAEMVIKLNKLNPQVAARVLEPLTHWRKFTEPHATQMKTALNQILAEKNLSNDVYELTYKSMQNA